MNLRPTLIALFAATALSACGQDHGHDHPSQPPAAAESATENRPAANETQAFYGDEAPVTIEAAPEDDHGHSHGDDGDHSHDDESHDHGDGSEPHAH